MDKKEFAWRLYESERDFIKHHENQRTNASSILAAISAALIVALSSGIVDEFSKLLVSLTLALVGLFGTIFSGKLYELIQMHAARSYAYLDIVNKEFPEVSIERIKKEVKDQQKIKFPFFSTRTLNKIWFRFHLLVMILGIALTGFIADQTYEWNLLVH